MKAGKPVKLLTATVLAAALGAGSAAAAPSAEPAPGLVFPVRGPHTFGEESDLFGAPRADGRVHGGQDVVAACETPVVAAAGGVISHRSFDAQGGHSAVIDGAAHDYVYKHLAAPSPLPPGAKVRAGQSMGAVGATGDARSCLLHFEVWTQPGYLRGQAIDPMPLLRAAGG